MSTLQRVTGQREWTSKHGPMVSIGLDFGEFHAQLNTKPEFLTKRLEMLETVVGKDSAEWAFEDAGVFDDGNPKPKKVSNYPGKVQQAQGGGGSRGRSPEQEAFIQERMDRRTALMQACEYARAYDTDGRGPAPWRPYADQFYDWLRQTSGTAAIAIPLSPAPSTGTAAVPDSSSVSEGHTEESVRTATTTTETDRAGLAAAGELGKALAAAPHKHEPDMSVAAKAGRYPCAKCGVWVKP